MEKLVLRGIMYGADKIPDSWFEKVPGGYFKEKEQERRDHNKDVEREKRRNKREKSRRRRHSDEYEDHRPRYDEDPYDSDQPGRASERHRRHARSRSSYDGGADYDPEEDERERRRARRRTYADGFSQPGSARHSYVPDGRPYDFSPVGSQRPSYHPDQEAYGRSRRERDAAAAAAAGAGTAAAMAQQTSRHTSTASPVAPVAPPNGPPSAAAAKYVPYANIYGSSASRSPAARQMFSPPPAPPTASSNSSVQANSINQVAPVGLPANPYDYPPAGTKYDSRGFPDPYSTTYSRPHDSFDYSRSPSPSLNSTATPPRRARSERRPNCDKERPRGKSLSRLQEKLGLSQQNLGYSAVGAVAGGLVGSGIGKGRMPAAIGAAIGGIGANALGANQRFVDPKVSLNNGAPLPPPPPGPPPFASNNRQQMPG